MKYIIQDWAGNVLNFKGRFELPSFAVAMEFDSFDDGIEWITENADDDRYDLYVLEKGSK